MLHPILYPLAWSLAVFVLYLVAQDLTMTSGRGLGWNMGARDGDAQQLGVVAARAERAFANLRETYPVFICLTVLALFIAPDSRLATLGAWVWLAARVGYLPLYLGGVPLVRSLVWIVSIGGLVTMAIAIFPI